LRVRLVPEQRAAVKTLAKERHLSMSQLLRLLIARELEEATFDSGSRRDESVIRDAAILIAVEQVLKLQEATIPGGITRSRQLLDAAADAAMARLATAEEILARADRQ
jgi:hypothetical protein